jgi:hypothetical protein
MPFNYTIDAVTESKKCKTCSKDIDKDELRFGSSAIYDEKANTVGSSFYRHVECVPRGQIIELLKLPKWNTNSVVKGWDMLSHDDRLTVTTKFQEIRDKEDEKKGAKKAKRKGGSRKSSGAKRTKSKAKGTKRKKNDEENDNDNDSGGGGGGDGDGDGDDEGTKKKKKSPKKKEKKDPDAPKRAPTPYMLFCSAKRPQLKIDEPKLKPTEIMTELGRMWKELNADDKNEFKQNSDKMKQIYLEKLKEYQKKQNGEDIEEKHTKESEEEETKESDKDKEADEKETDKLKENNNNDDNDDDDEGEKEKDDDIVESPKKQKKEETPSSPPSSVTVTPLVEGKKRLKKKIDEGEGDESKSEKEKDEDDLSDDIILPQKSDEKMSEALLVN